MWPASQCPYFPEDLSRELRAAPDQKKSITMDVPSQQRTSLNQRQLSNLKLVSRLLGHELHSQASAKAISLSRESVVEIQTTLDLFIEEASRSHIGINSPTGSANVNTRMVSTPS